MGQAQGGEAGDRGVGSPDAEPEQHVGDRNLRYLELRAVLAGPGRPEAVDVHLLSLSLQGLLVSHHRLHDGAVETANHGEGGEIVDNIGKKDKRFRIPFLSNSSSPSEKDRGKYYRVYEVVSTRYESSLHLVSSPTKEWPTADANSVGPDQHEDEEGLARGDLGPGEALDDDVVPVIADGDHGEDGADPRDGPRGSVQLAAQAAPHPEPLAEGVDDDGPGLGEHHAEVRQGQVHHEHVGGSSQGFHLNKKSRGIRGKDDFTLRNI